MIGNKKTIRRDFDETIKHVKAYLKKTGQCFAPYVKPQHPEAIAMKMKFGTAANNRTPMGVRKACETEFNTKFVKTWTRDDWAPNTIKLAA